MKKKYYHRKLVRDKLPELIKITGNEGETRVLGSKEFEKELKKKLVEESKELERASKESVLNELSDILELTKTISEHYKISFSRVEKYQAEKRKKKGGFKKRLFLVWSTQEAGK